MYDGSTSSTLDTWCMVNCSFTLYMVHGNCNNTLLVLLLLCIGKNESCLGLQQQQLCESEPLLNISYELESVLSGACELLEWYEFIGQEMNESDYHAVLGQNILDSCNWVRF